MATHVSTDVYNFGPLYYFTTTKQAYVIRSCCLYGLDRKQSNGQPLILNFQNWTRSPLLLAERSSVYPRGRLRE